MQKGVFKSAHNVLFETFEHHKKIVRSDHNLFTWNRILNTKNIIQFKHKEYHTSNPNSNVEAISNRKNQSVEEDLIDYDIFRDSSNTYKITNTDLSLLYLVHFPK